MPDPFPRIRDDRPAAADPGPNVPPPADGFGRDSEDPDIIIDSPPDKDAEQAAAGFLQRLRAHPLLNPGRFVRGALGRR